MYIDNLTLTAIVFFVIGLLCTVRFCIFGLCGGPQSDERYDDHRNDHVDDAGGVHQHLP